MYSYIVIPRYYTTVVRLSGITSTQSEGSSSSSFSRSNTFTPEVFTGPHSGESGEPRSGSASGSGSASYRNKPDLHIGGGVTHSTNKNSTYKRYRRNDEDIEESGTDPLQEVALYTTTTVEFDKWYRTTTSYTRELDYWTTSGNSEGKTILVNLETTTTMQMQHAETTTASRADMTQTGTAYFVTWKNWSENQIVVADSIIIPVGSGNQILILLSNNQYTDSQVITSLSYITAETTLKWIPPISTESSYTRKWYGGMVERYRDSPTEGSSPPSGTIETTSTTTSDSTSVETYAWNSYVYETVEDWVTFTTTKSASNSSGSYTFEIRSYSLNTGYTYMDEGYEDDEGNYVEGEQKTYTQQKVKYIVITNSFDRYYYFNTTTNVTITTYADVIESSTTHFEFQGPSLEFHSEKTGSINMLGFPWQIIEYAYGISAFSLHNTSSRITETTTSYRLIANDSTSAQTTNSTSSTWQNINNSGIDRGYRGTFDYASASEFSSSSSYESRVTNYQTLGAQPGYIAFGKAITWATAVRGWAVAANESLEFDTQLTKTEAPLLIGLEGNEHTFMLNPYYLPSVGFGELVPLHEPFFTSVLNKNSDSYGAHPSVWSTIRVSRRKNSLSSTWSSVDNFDTPSQSIVTSSGTCKFTTQSIFPLGVYAVEDGPIGGAYGNNSIAVRLQAPAVYHFTTGNKSTTGSSSYKVGTGEVETENISFVDLTVEMQIPVVSGYGMITVPNYNASYNDIYI